eukprot:8246140-Prorocentrum_lima.AAC.1
MGLRKLRQDFVPRPFSRRTQDQVHVPKEQLAQAAANYLSTAQWPAPSPTDPPLSHHGLIIADHLHFDVSDITLSEITHAVASLKLNKAPGPDAVFTEIVKLLEPHQLSFM